MRIQIPFGITNLELGTMSINSLKLRFNPATWSWVNDSISNLGYTDRCAFVVRENKSYWTIQLQTSDHMLFERVLKAIQQGQINQQHEMLERWAEFGQRPEARYCFKQPAEQPSVVGRINLDELKDDIIDKF